MHGKTEIRLKAGEIIGPEGGARLRAYLMENPRVQLQIEFKVGGEDSGVYALLVPMTEEPASEPGRVYEDPDTTGTSEP